MFAVIGAMVGYVMGQTMSRILVQFPDVMAGMSLNYSSMSAVWSALWVVAVVGFVVLYFGAPRTLASFCAGQVSGWTTPSMVCEFLGR